LEWLPQTAAQLVLPAFSNLAPDKINEQLEKVGLPQAEIFEAGSVQISKEVSGESVSIIS